MHPLTNETANTSAERNRQATRVAEMMKTPEIERAAALAESLRQMRASARTHWDGVARPTRLSITLDPVWLGDLSDAADLIETLTQSLDFYRRRVDALQAWQSSMRDPERTVVCDILANGHTLAPQFAGDRYGDMKAVS